MQILTAEEKNENRKKRMEKTREIFMKDDEEKKIIREMNIEASEINKMKHEIERLKLELVIKEKEYKESGNKDIQIKQEIIKMKRELSAIRF